MNQEYRKYECLSSIKLYGYLHSYSKSSYLEQRLSNRAARCRCAIMRTCVIAHPRHRASVGKSAISRTRSAQVFLELGRAFGPESLAGECSPPIDVYETDDAVEIVDRSAGRRPGGRPRRRQGRRRPDRRRQSAAPRPRRIELSPGRARLRTLRAGGPPRPPCDTVEGAAPALINGELRIAVPKSPNAAGRAINQHRHRRKWLRSNASHDCASSSSATSSAGRAASWCGRGCGPSSSTTASISSLPTPRTRRPASASRAKSASSCSTGAST